MILLTVFVYFKLMLIKINLEYSFSKEFKYLLDICFFLRLRLNYKLIRTGDQGLKSAVHCNLRYLDTAGW